MKRLPNWFRVPTIIEIVVQCLLAFVLVVLVEDLITAYGSRPCGTGGGGNCYPWGAEGPVAGVWAYTSKAHYLATIAIEALLVLICFLIPFVVDGPKKSLMCVAIGFLIFSIVHTMSFLVATFVG